VVQHGAPAAARRGARRLGGPRYRGAGATQRYAAIYHFAHPDVPNSQAWKSAANTPWTERMRPHFRDFLRIDARRYARKT
jgi:hypothetical protein